MGIKPGDIHMPQMQVSQKTPIMIHITQRL